MKGTCALDWAHTGCDELARAQGIDLAKYFPVAIELHGLAGDWYTILAVDIARAQREYRRRLRAVPRDSVSLEPPPRSEAAPVPERVAAIHAFLQAHPRRLPVAVFPCYESAHRITDYVKEFSALLLFSTHPYLRYFKELTRIRCPIRAVTEQPNTALQRRRVSKRRASQRGPKGAHR